MATSGMIGKADGPAAALPAMAAPTTAAAHDHGACVGDALAAARSLCAGRGVKLTPLRERVLELVWSGHKPRGAYAILEDLSRDGRRVAPLTVYRALDFLVEQGLVHRIESQNAFIGCADPGISHAGQFLVCEGCGNATELNDPGVVAAIAASAAARGFAPIRQTVEVLGRCPDCRGGANGTHRIEGEGR